MDVETVRAKMMAQVDMARQSAMASAHGWTFEIQGLVVYVIMRHRRKSECIYMLRADFEKFPSRAPSYTFVDRNTKQPTAESWPPKVMHSQNRICTPGTREFHQELHKNDARYPWAPERYTFLSTVSEIHRLMERGLGG